MKTNTERRNFFKKAGLSAISAGVFSMIPFKLFTHSHSHHESKSLRSNENIPIKINPMAVKRENKK